MDCTHTFHTGAGTGIQRLVRRMADSLLEVAPSFGVRVVPVRIERGELVPLPLEGGRVAFPRAESAREIVKGPAPRVQRLRWIGHGMNRILRSRRLADWLEAGPNENGLARCLAEAPREAPKRLTLTAGDVLLCLDSSWVYDVRSALEAAARVGALRVAMLCDVLPLTQPQWFTEGTRRYFRGWIEALLPRLDGIVAISRSTCCELSALVDTRRIRARSAPECIAVHLGAEVEAASDAPVRPELRECFDSGKPPAFLTVGTLEPRKNVDFAIDVFDALAERGLDFQWHIVGAPGWLAEHTAERIQNHPQYGRRLRWWTDLNDAELDACYRSAAALVAVSRAEGFGLPLVEARMRGLPVFASDIPVFREVLRDEGRYVPLGDAKLAAAALEDFVAGRLPLVAASASGVARAWTESASELLAAIRHFGEARRGARAAA